MIQQAQVDGAPTLPEVLAQFDAWRLERGLHYSAERKDFAFAADGPWDLRFFLHGECVRKAALSMHRIGANGYYKDQKWGHLAGNLSTRYDRRRCAQAGLALLREEVRKAVDAFHAELKTKKVSG